MSGFKKLLNKAYEYIEREYDLDEFKQRLEDKNVFHDYAIYNEMFCYIDEKAGKDEVVVFWLNIARDNLEMLKNLVTLYGPTGCCLYWGLSLSNANADAEISLDTLKEIFTIKMKHCPAFEQITGKPYKDYCEHCKIMYGHILRPLGYKIKCEYNGQGQCDITVEKQENK